MREVYLANHETFHKEIFHFVEQANAGQEVLRFRRLRLEPAERALLARERLDTAETFRVLGQIRRRAGLPPDAAFVLAVDGNVQDLEDDEYFIRSSADSPSFGPPGNAILSFHYLREGSTFHREAEAWWQLMPERERRRFASDSVLLLLNCAVTLATLEITKTHSEARGCVMDYCQSPAEIALAVRKGFRFCDEECRPHLEGLAPEGPALLAISRRLGSTPFREVPLVAGEFDVFLCHHSRDRGAVAEIGEMLKDRGLVPWRDVEQLRPGLPWQRSLEEQIRKVRTAAVFVGPAGFGPWQDMEIEAFLRQFIRRESPVIPVVLPEVEGMPKLPSFLEGMTWVDFRAPETEPLERLIWGITGRNPFFPA